MANKEGFIDKGLDAWQKWNKATLAVEVGMVVAGLGLGYPWLLSLGLAGAAIDGAQIVAINYIKNKREKAGNSMRESAKPWWKNFMPGVVFDTKNPQPLAV